MADTEDRGYQDAEVLRWRADAGMQPAEHDWVAQEVPVALVFNGISHAVMMATPLDLEDFALGFSLGERIVDTPSQIYDIECVSSEAAGGWEVQVTLAAECFARLKEKRRQLAGRTGCGICGTESLQALDLDLPRVADSLVIAPEHLARAFEQMRDLQTINAKTGAVHAAVWADSDGRIRLLREDVGRHNALDKLVGALAAATQDRVPGFAFMSSRASYELVQKAARAQIGILATVSAPTGLAIQMAERAGITLLGFLRGGSFNIYTQAQRVAIA